MGGKEVNLKMIIGAGEAKPSAPLGPVLGQYQINMIQFCQEFNTKTQNVIDGMPLRVSVLRFENKTYIMKIKKPSVMFFIKQLVTNGSISKESLFDVVRLDSFFNNRSFLDSLYCVFGSLSSKKIKIV